jgi:hypothetical protein
MLKAANKLPTGTYTVTVGGGGSGNAQSGDYSGSNGSDSLFGGITSYGGGGGSGNAHTNSINGKSGGSGGGAHASYGNSAPRVGYVGGSTRPTGGSGVAGQGFSGGLAYDSSDVSGQVSGGGGGANTAGTEGGLNTGGNGGTGKVSYFSGSPTYYAGGGGGGVWNNGTPGSGGNGGGGTGGYSVSPTAGSTNSGGGGGGGNGIQAYYSLGAAGGSGIVIVRYLGSAKATGGTITSVNGYTVHTFTGTTTFTVSSESWNDLSGCGNNVTLTNGPTYISDHGGAILFDGVNDYVAGLANSFLYNSSQGTFEGWINTSTISGGGSYAGVYNIIIGKASGPDNAFGFSSLGSLKLRLNAVDLTANTIISLNTWYHVAATWSTGGMNLYLNGVLDGSNSNAQTWEPSTYPTQIARMYSGGAGGSFTGKIGLLRAYDRILTQTEITQNFNSSRRRFGL